MYEINNIIIIIINKVDTNNLQQQPSARSSYIGGFLRQQKYNNLI